MDVYQECLGQVRRWMTLTFFQGRGSLFKNENLRVLLVNTITQQILVALGPNYAMDVSSQECLG